jgi:hypothetical protein
MDLRGDVKVEEGSVGCTNEWKIFTYRDSQRLMQGQIDVGKWAQGPEECWSVKLNSHAC